VSKKVMQDALYALECLQVNESGRLESSSYDVHQINVAKDALRAALAQPDNELEELPEPANARVGWSRTEYLPWNGPAYSADQMRAFAKNSRQHAPTMQPLTPDQIFASQEMMHLNGSLLQLDMSQLMLLVRAVENLHNIKTKESP